SPAVSSRARTRGPIYPGPSRRWVSVRNFPRMLARLSIRDIVLIERLDIEFSRGLAVLTGETGAGKSILLDAFALALGGRGDAAPFARCLCRTREGRIGAGSIVGSAAQCQRRTRRAPRRHGARGARGGLSAPCVR